MLWDNEGLLEVVELLAIEMGNISDEDELSAQFDEDIAPHVIKEYGEDDEVAINESFSNWSDSLCKDGVIHPIQYHEYCYVGKWA